MGSRKPFRAVPVRARTRHRGRGAKGNVVRFRRRNDFPLIPALIGIALATLAAIGAIYWFDKHRAAEADADRPPTSIAADEAQRLWQRAREAGRAAIDRAADSRAPATPSAARVLTGPDVFTCQVARINDGDTLRCADGTRVRLNAVAARERDGSCTPGHPCPPASAEAATAELERLASGQVLQCRQTGTSYNRKAAICVNEAGVEINCAMVRSGTALVWPRYAEENPICVY